MNFTTTHKTTLGSADGVDVDLGRVPDSGRFPGNGDDEDDSDSEPDEDFGASIGYSLCKNDVAEHQGSFRRGVQRATGGSWP
jgi:hypothetical protein